MQSSNKNSMAKSKVIDDPAIRSALKQAWEDSLPGTANEHEEGGFIIINMTGNLEIVRWPKGQQNSILVPAHSDCKIDDKDIIATFHTHPNTEDDHLQEPSETDKRAIRDDLDLKGKFYEGEFVISKEKIYLIASNGVVSEVGDTCKILAET